MAYIAVIDQAVYHRSSACLDSRNIQKKTLHYESTRDVAKFISLLGEALFKF
jgi:hypothetical protein